MSTDEQATTQSPASDDTRQDYWERYYSSLDASKRPLPSQFATFVAGELQTPHRVVDFGCGNGRDSLFFSHYGHQVVGIDAAQHAVEHCRLAAELLGESAQFVASLIDDPELADRVPPSALPTAVYARFFLHAITEEEQTAFFRAAAALTRPGDVMAVEYRTVRDVTNEKVTDRHYRRYLDPFELQLQAIEFGFRTEYAVEGFGYAKYRKDDAYVARCLLRRG